MAHTFTVTVAFEDGREVTRTFPDPEDVGAYLHDLDSSGVAYAIVHDVDDGPEDGAVEGVSFAMLGATLTVEALYRQMLFETETLDAPEVRAMFAAVLAVEPEGACRAIAHAVTRYDAGHRLTL